MTAESLHVATAASEPVGRAEARERIAAGALADAAPGAVGLELEAHLVDLAEPLRRPDWTRVSAALAALPPLPSGSPVTVEPGGQLEISTPPAADVAEAVALLRADLDVLRGALAPLGLGATLLGADPARPPHRVNPRGRYAAMEEHFSADGTVACGRAMMTATAALQVCLEPGRAVDHATRWSHVARLAPVLAAISACSPFLGGRSSGWASRRQEAWWGIDHRRTGWPATSHDPAGAWADHALDAPVMFVSVPGADPWPVLAQASLGAWLERPDLLGRAATWCDVETHLTTLFPPVRPRGYLELRFLDAVPDRWWPGLAVAVVTLIDHPRAAQDAAGIADRLGLEPAVPVTPAGLDDPATREAAVALLRIAATYAGPSTSGDVEALLDLHERGGSLAQEVREAVATRGVGAVLQDGVHA